MSSAQRLRSPVALALAGLLVLLVVAGTIGRFATSGTRAEAADVSPTPTASAASSPSSPSSPPTSRSATPRPKPAAPTAVSPAGHPPYVLAASTTIAPKSQLPGGGFDVFGHHRFLVAYYGTAQTGSMGVLGATDPDTMQRRLERAALPFREAGEQIQPVYELIVTIADRSPGPDGDYSHDIPRSLAEEYIQAAHRNGALLLLDLQTGRAPFPEVAQRWTWALEDPWVGLALDPEWRMGPHQVPASVIGSVKAREVNQTSAWLSQLVHDNGLPEKLFVLHQFRMSMLPDISDIVHRPGLAMVQHADGFGTRGQKLATYHAITQPQQFRQGFKLFYRWDVHRFTPQQVREITPAVSFVSYQ